MTRTNRFRNVTRWAALAALASVSGSSLAQTGAGTKAGEQGGAGTKVVARSGEATIQTGAVERRLRSLSSAELQALGGAPNEAPRRLVEQVMAFELSAELGARARGLDKAPGVADRTREILRQALERSLRAETLRERPITEQEIAAYYEANRARFEQPARVRIWRILVDDAAQAQKLLDEARKAGDTTKWSELTRQHSIDKATNMRQGDLGFVRPDGSTDVPRVMVDPALFKAVDAVKDGEFVPNPVSEAGKFAVVWRRGSLPERKRSLAEESASIRQLLERKRVDEARKALLAKLRNESVKDEKPELLEKLPDGVLGDAPAPRARAASPARPAELVEPPRPTERGLR